MKLKICIIAVVVIILLVFFWGVHNRIVSSNEKKQPVSEQKIKADINEVHNERGILRAQPDKTKTEPASDLKALDSNRQASKPVEGNETIEVKPPDVNLADESQKHINTAESPKNGEVNTETLHSAAPADPNQLQNKAVKPPSDILAKKLQEAESYLNARNWQAAERLFWEINATDANYPGLDALNSRIQNLKSRLNGQTKPPQ
jgi:hypothetical protein